MLILVQVDQISIPAFNDLRWNKFKELRLFWHKCLISLRTLFTNFSLQAVQEKLLGANVDLNRHSMLAEKIKCSVWFKSIKYLLQRLMVWGLTFLRVKNILAQMSDFIFHHHIAWDSTCRECWGCWLGSPYQALPENVRLFVILKDNQTYFRMTTLSALW